jgi:hypothetical protein
LPGTRGLPTHRGVHLVPQGHVKRYIDYHPGYLEKLAERFQKAPEDDPQLPPGYDEF